MFYHGGMPIEYREEPCKVALNRVKGMPFEWSLNPYMGCVHRCTFCYVRAFERRADRPADDRYGRAIRVKGNIPERPRAGPTRRSWDGGGIAIGAATDPYQPAEGRYALTRACLLELCRAANPFSIITRGPLIVRDVDVLAEASRRADVSVTFSVPTVDDDVWRTTEPGTAPPRQRLRALKVLVDAGVRVSVGMGPLLPGLPARRRAPLPPGLSAHPRSLERVVVAAREAGACGIWANLLYLAPGTREHFLDCLERDWPELLPDYEELYARGRAYVPAAEAKPAKDTVRKLAREYEVRDRRPAPIKPAA